MNLSERPSINADLYMILRAPNEFVARVDKGSAKAFAAQKKYEVVSAYLRAFIEPS